MGLNKPITVGGGLTAAEVQTIIDAQTTAISGKVDAQTTAISEKVDAQTNTLKTDIPSSISGGASISDINAALDEKLPQYSSGTVVKSNYYGVASSPDEGTNDFTIALSNKINPSNTQVFWNDCANYSSGNVSRLTEINENYVKFWGYRAICYQIVEFS